MATLHDPAFLKEQIGFSNPDYVMFVPKQLEGESDNVHLYVVEHEKYGGLLAFWTQSTVENHGNNHLVMAGSRDGGKSWSAPKFLRGAHPDGESFGVGEMQASWGFPIVTRSGRIYLFYYQQLEGYKDNSYALGGYFTATHSDDCGETWSKPAPIKQRKTPYDWDEYLQDNIVFELPQRGPDGRYLAGFTKYVSQRIPEERRGGTRIYFYRFDNVDDDPEVKDLKITTLPACEDGISICRPTGKRGHAQEPSLVTLPDGQLFCSFRTNLGKVFFATSADHGMSWSAPRPLTFTDFTPFTHPIAPCPIYDLGDGRYMLLYHGVCNWDDLYVGREQLRAAIGYFDPDAKHQPIRFEKADDKLWMELPEAAETLGCYGKELPMYGTLTRQNGKNVLWYPDRKFFLLGKEIQ